MDMYRVLFGPRRDPSNNADPVDYEVPSGGAVVSTPLSLPATDGTGGTDAVEHAAWYCVVPIIVVASLGLGITVWIHLHK